MNERDALKSISLDDLQEQYREYAEVIGVENLLNLSQFCGGTQIYIPKTDELLKELKYRCIRAEYNGENIRQLAIKYNVSESTIYRIVRDMIKVVRTEPIVGQLSLFDCQTHCH